MNILDIYKKYDLMPQLVEHQLKVAAVGYLICQNFKGEIDRNNIVAACLLHDMGNIVKFSFDPETLAKMPGLMDPATVPHWEKVQAEWLQKYGSGSHRVTMKVVEELGVSERITELVNSVGFSQGIENVTSPDFGKKICCYADMRLKPSGVALLEERLADLRVRYKDHPEGSASRDAFDNALREMEKQIFEHCDIKPFNITEQSIAGIKEELKKFNLQLK